MVPSARAGPLRSGKSLSSAMVVSRVQHLSPLSRNWPRPRAVAVSKVNQASVRPFGGVAFAGLDVPSECDQIAPVAVGVEHGGGLGDIAFCQRLLKGCEPVAHLLCR